MDIYIVKNNSRSGPYSESQVQDMLTAGMVSIKDSGWHEGLPEWVTLGEIMQNPGQPSAVALPVTQGHESISRGVFRCIVGLSILFLIAQIISGIVCSLPDPLQTYSNTKSNSNSQATDILYGISFIVLIGLLLASYIGLFLVHKWGRLLFTITTGLAVMLTLFMGPDVEAAASNAFGSLFDMTNGAILSIAYCTGLFSKGSRT
jgi:hypothetical protein